MILKNFNVERVELKNQDMRGWRELMLYGANSTMNKGRGDAVQGLRFRQTNRCEEQSLLKFSTFISFSEGCFHCSDVLRNMRVAEIFYKTLSKW